MNARKGEGLEFARTAARSTQDECLLWPYGITATGYGNIWVNGRQYGAHRYVCILAHGIPPEPDMETAHGCGNRACVNPRHLRWATTKENHSDKKRHGTLLCREANPASKLTSEQVDEIRRLYLPRPIGRGRPEDGPSQRELARQFGVTQHTIMMITKGRHWI